MSVSRRDLAVLDEYCGFVDAVTTARALKEGVLRSILTESFSSKSFANMISQLSRLEKMLPEDMENTLKALHRAAVKSEKDYAKLIRRKISKEDFAKSVAQTKGLVDGLSNVFEELQQLLASRRFKQQISSRVGLKDNSSLDVAGSFLGEVLDDSQIDILKARIEQAFEQPTSILGQFWKSMSPQSYGWYGLTDRDLFEDILSLSREGLQTIGGIDADVIDDLFPPQVEQELEAVAEAGDFEEMTFELPADGKQTDGELEADDKTSETIVPDDNAASVTPLDAPERAPIKKASEAPAAKEDKALSLKDLLAKHGDGAEVDPAAKKALIGALQKAGIKIKESADHREDRYVMDQWRRMAGIPRSDEEGDI